MPDSSVSIVVSAKQTASGVLKQVSDALHSTQKAADDLTSGLSRNQKAWNDYAVRTGQVGSSLTDFITKEAAAKEATAKLTDAHKASSSAAKESEGILSRLSGRLSSLASSASGASGGMRGIFGDLAGVAGGGGAIGAGIAAIGVAALGVGVKVSSEMEQIETAFTTLLGSAEAAAKAMDMIKQDATNTPFDPQGLAQLNLQLTGITHNAGQSEQILMNFGKAMAAMGRNGGDLNAVMTQVIQVLNKGKLEMQDVKPIQNYIDIYGVMSRNLDIPREKLQQMQKEGKLTADMLLEAFERASTGSGEFANAYENSAGTLASSAQNLFEKLKLGLSTFAEQSGVFDLIKGGFQLLNAAVDNSTIAQTFAVIAGVIRVAGTGIIATIEVIIGAIKSLFTLSWKPFADSLVSAQHRVEGAMATSWSNIGKAQAKSSQDQVNAFRTSGDQMTADNAAKLLKIKQQEDEANAEFDRQQDQRARQFQQAMTDMIIAHRDKALSIKADLADEEAAYVQSNTRREQALNEDLASLEESHLDRVANITDEISKEKNSGLMVDGVLYRQANEQKLAELQKNLDEENAKYAVQVEKRRARYAKDVADAKVAHDQKIAALQTSLDQETAILQKHAAEVAAVGNKQKEDDITRLKQQFVQQTQLANEDHARAIARIRKQATDQGLTGGLSYTKGLKNAMDIMGGELSGKASSLGKDVGKSLGKGIADGITDGFKPDPNSFLGKLATNVASLKNDTGNTFKALGAGVADFLGLTYKGQKVSKLMGFARGGVIDRHTLLVDMQTGRPYGQMAEGNRPEAIVPMVGRGAGGTGGQSITIGAVNLYNQTDTSAFLREIAFELD